MPTEQQEWKKDESGQKKKVAFCVASYGTWSVVFRRNFIDFLIEQFRRRNYLFAYCESNATYQHMAREELALRAVDEGADYLFYIDTDSLLPRDCLDKLMAHDLDIVSGLYYNRGWPYNPVVYQWTAELGDRLQPHAICSMVGEFEPRLYEVGAVGFGAVLIKADVFKRIHQPWFLPSLNNEVFMGEDVFFCYRARQTGIKVHLDASIKVGHITDKSVVITPDNWCSHKQADTEMPKQKALIGDPADLHHTKEVKDEKDIMLLVQKAYAKL